MNEGMKLTVSYKPIEFIRLNYDVIELKHVLKLTLTEAIIFNMLLQEYEVHHSKFPTRSFRNHVQTMREKFMLLLNSKIILSSNAGIYSILDRDKKLIHDYIQEHGSK